MSIQRAGVPVMESETKVCEEDIYEDPYFHYGKHRITVGFSWIGPAGFQKGDGRKRKVLKSPYRYEQN